MAFVLVGGSRTFVGPVVGGLVLTALPEALRGLADVGGLPPWLAQFLRDGRLIIFGVLIAIGTVFFPHGLITPGLLRRFGRRRGGVRRMSVAPAVAREGAATSAGSLLAVDRVTCQFGGVLAVNAVSFAVGQGELFGLIGPNGAGKTTLFNLITGLTAPTRGTLRYRGEDITGLPPHRVAERGIARTFQNVRLFGELSALDQRDDRAPRADAERARQRRARPLLGPAGGAPDARARGGTARPGRPRRPARGIAPATSPTATSGGWRSPARWRSSPSCSCSTSRRRA